MQTESTREKILRFIRQFVDDRGYAPTVRDILRGCALSSTAVVQHHLKMLEREGVIHRDPEIFRSIKLMDRASLIQVPVLGTIAAGEPISVPDSGTWNSYATETLEVADDFSPGKDVFALKVKGLSMIDALIDDGDIVLMEQATSANNGDMVAAWLKDREEITLKKFYKERDSIRLQPANAAMSPVICSSDNVEIQGKVIGVIRKL
jgi:repressor LexA